MQQPIYIVKVRIELARVVGKSPDGKPLIAGVVNVEETGEGPSYRDAYEQVRGNLRPTIEGYGLESTLTVVGRN